MKFLSIPIWITGITAHYKGCIFSKQKYKKYIDEISKLTYLDYRVTGVTTPYKGRTF